MAIGNIFSRTTGNDYFNKNITPKCSYCQSGKRSSDGTRILCGHAGIKSEDDSCKKFIYSPLKRIPVKQLSNEGAFGESSMYDDTKGSEDEGEETA